jgi:two-component system, OmpR family, response regulator
MGRILVVDDDPNIRELAASCLGPLGLEVAEAPGGREALALLGSTKVDLVVLDVMMPGLDGWTTCREIKRRYELPVIMLTAMGESSHKVKGFELGADDYLVKPFDPPELLARAKSLLRRFKAESTQTVEAGSLVLDRRRFEVLAEGDALTIPLKEFELLFKLAASPGTTFTRAQLLAAVWGDEFEGVERTVDVHINRIRERFPEERYGYRITTIRGLGYRLEAER